jgi:hypothetical protein
MAEIFVIHAVDCPACGQIHEELEVRQSEEDENVFIETCPVTGKVRTIRRV